MQPKLKAFWATLNFSLLKFLPAIAKQRIANPVDSALFWHIGLGKFCLIKWRNGLVRIMRRCIGSCALLYSSQFCPNKAVVRIIRCPN